MKTILCLVFLYLLSCTPGRGTHNKFIANVRDGNFTIIRILLEKRFVSNVDAPDEEGNTALMWASALGYKKIVRLLVEHGANVRAKNASGRDALDVARESNRMEVTTFLESTVLFSRWKSVIVSNDEPGEPMIVSGRVFAPDDKTAVEGISVHVYHTDAKGYYNVGSTSSRNPKLRGTMRTNEEGRYEYRTVKPASYPQGRNPAHVHYVISGKGYSEQYDELEFEGDPYHSDEHIQKSKKLGTFGLIQRLERGGDGVLRCTKDIRLQLK